MIGIVLVSHSEEVAAGVARLAAQMAAPEVRIAPAGGLDEPGVLGTDAARVARAIDDVWSDDGVLVLMDLGSAVLSAEFALDQLDNERRDRVLLTAAPLVEGAVAAAVTAGLGEPLEACAAAARRGLEAKAAQLGEEAAGGEAAAPDGAGPGAAPRRLRVRVTPRLGLHARPAALLVRTAGRFDARVTIADATNGRGPVSARSLTAVSLLGAACGDDLLLTAEGPEAAQALDAVRRLSEAGFGEPDEAGQGRGAAGPAGAGGTGPTPAAPAATVPASARGAGERPPAPGTVLRGVPASPGAAVGRAMTLRPRAGAPSGRAPCDPGAEWAALGDALGAVARDIAAVRERMARVAGSGDAGIFDAHLLFLEDEGLLDATREGVFDRGETAAQAWATAVAAVAAQWDGLADAYQRERAADLRAVSEQLLTRLREKDEEAGRGGSRGATPAGTGARVAKTAERGSSAGPAVLLAYDLTPGQVAALDTALVAGVACAAGGPTSHAAILARALGVPAVVAVGPAVLDLAEGTLLAVDGDAGTVTVRPDADAVDEVRRRREQAAASSASAREAAAEPAVTRDGLVVAVEANVTDAREAAAAVQAGADGAGLLRTEFLFLEAATPPGENEQAAAYGAVATALGGRPLTIRTLDAGADKPLAYLPLEPEANPFLGVRGLRLGLAHPEHLLAQLRAVLRTAARFPVRVMFPMVATVDELRRARALVDDARTSLLERGTAVPDVLATGVMLEVPSAALVADMLAPLVDFFSVGTNDLTQYTLAAERGNAGVAGLYDPLHPAVLRLIGMTADAAAAADRPVAVCGELAADPLAVPLLLGLGVRELSVAPASVALVKQAVRHTDVAAARAVAREALRSESGQDVRRLLAEAEASGGG